MATCTSMAKKNKVGKHTTFYIDLYKENPNVIHFTAKYDRPINDINAFNYIGKQLKPTISKYFKHNITVVESSPIKNKYSIVALDLCVRIPNPMTTIEKRKWAYDKNGLVFDMFKDIDKNLCGIIDKYESLPKKYWKCGDFIYE